MDNQFIVWCPTSHRPPKVIHDAYTKASTEARRLAEENIGSAFHVAQIVGTAVAPRPKAEFTMHVHPSQADVDLYLAEVEMERQKQPLEDDGRARAAINDAPAPLQIREGGWYRRRDGEIVGPAEHKKGYVRSNPWLVGPHFYADDGQWMQGCPDPRDLIGEAPAPTAPAATDDGEIPF